MGGHVRHDHGRQEACAYRQAGGQLDAEDHRLGNPVDDRSDDDPHGAARAARTELLVDDRVADEEDGHADQHPQSELPRLESDGLADEVEGHRSDHRASAEAGENAHDLLRDRNLGREDACEEERGLGQQAKSEGAKHLKPPGW